MQQAAAPEERPTLNYLVSLIKTNCVPDVDVTLQARARSTDVMSASERYEAHQIIAHRGQVVDRRLKAALDQLREHMPAMVAPMPPEKAQSTPAKAQESQQSRQWTQWVGGVMCGFVLALLTLVWLLARRSRPSPMLPLRVSGNGGSGGLLTSGSHSETILVPAKFEEPASAEVHEPVGPHLARVLMNKLVRRLLLQRTSLLESQHLAAAEMAALESRLEKVNAPLQERLRAYEERILELEKELAQKGAENRELIRFKIQLVRTQLASTKDRLELN
jgi:hypothetical protein